MPLDLEAVAQFFGDLAEAQRAHGHRLKAGASPAILVGVLMFSLFGAECAPASA